MDDISWIPDADMIDFLETFLKQFLILKKLSY